MSREVSYTLTQFPQWQHLASDSPRSHSGAGVGGAGMGQPQGALRFFQVSTCSLACSSDLITHVDLGIFDEDRALPSPSGSLLPSGAHCFSQPLTPTATPLLTLHLYDPVISGLSH